MNQNMTANNRSRACGFPPQRMGKTATLPDVRQRKGCRRLAPPARKLLPETENPYAMKKLNALIEDSKQAVRYWWLLLLVGVLLAGIGVLVLIFPARSYLGMSLLFGWVILLSGCLEVILPTANSHFVTGRGWMLVGGIIEIVLGVILILNVGLSASTLPLFLGFWLLMRAFATIGLSGDMQTLDIPGAGWTLLTGILLLVCSLGILLQPTGVGSAAVVVWVGITLLFAGAAACSMAIQLRRAHHGLNPRS